MILQECKPFALQNENLSKLNSDTLYHLGINVRNTDAAEIKAKFGDVKFVCLGGTKKRMAELWQHLRNVLDVPGDESLIDLCEEAHRFSVYKVGPVLCCSHGIGMASMSVLLHELIKLMAYANCKDPVFLRVGTCGGIGLKPGTVVVTQKAYNGYLRNEHEMAILGKRVVRPAKFNETVIEDIVRCSQKTDSYDTIIAHTLAVDCFYEGQGRLDGAICTFQEKEKMKFLEKCLAYGIRNIEMEATMFASLTMEVGIKAGDICVTLLDRLKGDQIDVSNELKRDFEKRPLIVVGRYIKAALDQFK